MTKREFEEMYRKHCSMVRKWALDHGPGEMVEEIVQEVFCTAWRKREELVCHNYILGWLRQTTLNKSRECWKRRQIFLSLSEEEVAGVFGQPEEAYVLVEWQQIVEKAVGAKEGRLFAEYYYFHIPIAELARREKMSEAALRMKLCRLKNKIKYYVINHNN